MDKTNQNKVRINYCNLSCYSTFQYRHTFLSYAIEIQSQSMRDWLSILTLNFLLLHCLATALISSDLAHLERLLINVEWLNVDLSQLLPLNMLFKHFHCLIALFM